jgi:membrane associated rhomboid family serine protease
LSTEPPFTPREPLFPPRPDPPESPPAPEPRSPFESPPLEPPLPPEPTGLRRIFRLPPPPPFVTLILILSNVVMAVAVTIDEHLLHHPSSLIDFGAKDRLLIESGESWRLVTAAFLHEGALHLLVNLYALWILGTFCEPIYGRARFLMIYLAAAIGGSLASTAFTAEPSVGASGALFGLLGAALVFGFRHRHDLPAAMGRRLRGSLVFWLMVNLALGWMFPFIDAWGHIGGLIGGSVAALLLGNAVIRPRGAEGSVRAGAALAGGLAVVCLALGVWNRANVSYETLDGWDKAAGEIAAGDVGTGLEELDRALAGTRGREPWLVMLHLDRARALALSGEAEEAADEIEVAAGWPLDRARYPWAIDAAERFALLDRYADAERLYRSVLKRHQVPSAANNLAWLYLTAEDPKFYRPGDALKLAERAVRAESRNPFYLGTLGAAQLRLARYQLAIDNLTKAVNLHVPGDEGTDLYLLVIALAGMGRRAESQAVLDHAIENFPSDSNRDEAERALRRSSLSI